VIMLVRQMGLHWAEAEIAARRTLEYARQAGNGPLVARAIPSLGICAQCGPMPVSEAIERLHEHLEEVRGERKPEALLEVTLAHLEAMRGNVEEARSLYRGSRAKLEELGWTFLAAQTSYDSGPIEMLAGDLDAAEAELRRDFDAFERMGETNYISTTAALLSEVLYRQGSLAEAHRYTEVSEELASHDDVTSQFRWRAVRAKVLARGGSVEEAEAMARQAVELIAESDEINSRAQALMDLVEVLRIAGRQAEAAAAAREALELFEAKGNTVSAATARGTVGELEALGVS
jgi:ATP/maltotriose-dependent transcriptional regulator MalT